MAYQDWISITRTALEDLLGGFVNFIPKLIGAIVIFVIGWFIAVWIGKIIAEILKRARFDKIFEKTKWDEALDKAEFKMKMSGFIGGLIKWVLVIVFLGASVRILGLSQVGDFVDSIVGWLPNLVVATAIFVVTVIVADFAEKLVKAIVSKMHVGYVHLIGAIVRWAIWIFAALAILNQFGVEGADNLIQIIVGGVILAMALAFGLGGKDVARDILQGTRQRLKK